MGIILDSSVLITAERQGQNTRQMLVGISRAAGDAENCPLCHHSHRTGTWRCSRKYRRTKAEATAVYPGIAHSGACSSSHGVSCPSRGYNRWRLPGERRASPSGGPAYRCNCPGTRLQRGYWKCPPLSTNPGSSYSTALIWLECTLRLPLSLIDTLAGKAI